MRRAKGVSEGKLKQFKKEASLLGKDNTEQS